MSETEPRLVDCKKLGRSLPGLPRAPFKNDLGARIYEEISSEAWSLWKEHAKLLLNEYRLNLALPDAQAFLMAQCEAFFFSDGSKRPEEFAPRPT